MATNTEKKLREELVKILIDSDVRDILMWIGILTLVSEKSKYIEFALSHAENNHFLEKIKRLQELLL